MQQTSFAARDSKGHAHITMNVPVLLLESLDSALRDLRIVNGEAKSLQNDDWKVRVTRFQDGKPGIGCRVAALFKAGNHAIGFPGLEIRLVQIELPKGQVPAVSCADMGLYGFAFFSGLPPGVFRAECGLERLSTSNIYPHTIYW